MTIRQRLWLLPVVVMVIFAIGISFSFIYTKQTSDGLIAVGREDFPYLEKSQALILLLQRLQEQLRNSVAEGDQGAMVQAKAVAGAFLKTTAEMSALPGKQDKARQIRLEFDAYFKIASQAAELMIVNKSIEASQAISAMLQAQKKLESTLSGVRAEAQQQFEQRIDTGTLSARSALIANMLSSIAVTLALLLSARLVVQRIWRALGGEPEYAAKIMSGIAAGDLSAAIEVARGAPASVLVSVRAMQQDFSRLIENIRDLAQQVRHSSAEISAGNYDLSQRTESQSSELEKTASNITQLTDAVNQNQRTAMKAQSLSQDSAAHAQKGAATMNEVVSTMGQISESSAQIVDIIGIIESVAFQTNILALNAAIEAARAGVHGRGFAVVASEVRSLAQRCTLSSQKIRELIQASTAKIQEGAVLTQTAGNMVTQIACSTRDVQSMITEIAAASTRQAARIEQISHTVNQLEAVTQSNAAMVEQSAAATQSLTNLSAELVQAVDVFKLSSMG